MFPSSAPYSRNPVPGPISGNINYSATKLQRAPGEVRNVRRRVLTTPVKLEQKQLPVTRGHYGTLRWGVATVILPNPQRGPLAVCEVQLAKHLVRVR